ncbi:hypothetical protein AVEN_52799-1, partial [Araneus ventricosus]
VQELLFPAPVLRVFLQICKKNKV